MGTRSTVKFIDSCGNNVLSLYQQYDGYIEGVGKQIYDLIKDIKIVDGFKFGDKMFEVANGIEDLALQYVIKYKDNIGNLYATTDDDEQEYNYIITQNENGELNIKIDTLFEGSKEEFIKYIDEEKYKEEDDDECPLF